MFPNNYNIESYQKLDWGQVVLGNNKTCKGKGIGTVRFKLHNATKLVLQYLRYVPNLKRNWISLGALDNKGCTFKSKRIACVMKGILTNGLCVLRGSTNVKSHALFVKDKDNSKLLNVRLGHISDKRLQELSKKCLIAVTYVVLVDLC